MRLILRVLQFCKRVASTVQCVIQCGEINMDITRTSRGVGSTDAQSLNSCVELCRGIAAFIHFQRAGSKLIFQIELQHSYILKLKGIAAIIHFHKALQCNHKEKYKKVIGLSENGKSGLPTGSCVP